MRKINGRLILNDVISTCNLNAQFLNFVEILFNDKTKDQKAKINQLKYQKHSLQLYPLKYK